MRSDCGQLALMKSMEDEAEQNNTIPSLDWLEDLMDRETLQVLYFSMQSMRKVVKLSKAWAPIRPKKKRKCKGTLSKV